MAETKYVGMMFSPESIQQIVAGNKTQTRRPVKQSVIDRCCYVHEKGNSQGSYRDSYGALVVAMGSFTYDIPAPVAKGDIIYVKEAWMNNPNYLFQRSQGLNHPEHYVKSCVSAQFLEEWPRSWKSPMYMPKVAARHFLEVLDVRVERLQDISPADAIAEGVESVGCTSNGRLWRHYGKPSLGLYNPVESYATMYDYVNRGKNRPKWADNPLVFAIKFRYLEGCQNPFQ